MKRYMIIGAIGLLMILMIAAWASSCQAPLFKGFYQSEMINGEVVQMSIYNDEKYIRDSCRFWRCVGG